MASEITKTNSYLNAFKQAASSWATRENVILTGSLAAGLLFGPYAMAGGLALWAQDRFLSDESEVIHPVIVAKVEPKKADPKTTRAASQVLRPQYKPPFHLKGAGLVDTPYSVSSQEEYERLYGDLPEAPQDKPDMAAPALAGGASTLENPGSCELPADSGQKENGDTPAPLAGRDQLLGSPSVTAPALEKPGSSELPADSRQKENGGTSAPLAGIDQPLRSPGQENPLTTASQTALQQSAARKELVPAQEDPLRTAAVSQTAEESPAQKVPLQAVPASQTALLLASTTAGKKDPAAKPAAKPAVRGSRALAPLPVGLPGLPLIQNAGSTCYLSAILWAFFFDDPLIEERVRLVKATREEVFSPAVLENDTGYQLLVHLDRQIKLAKEGKPIGLSEMHAFRIALMKHVPQMAPETVLFYDKAKKKYFEGRMDQPMGQKDAEAALGHLMGLVFDQRAWTFGVEKRIKPEVDGVELVESSVRAVEENAWHIPLTLPFDDQGKILQGVSFGAVVNNFLHEDYTDVSDAYKIHANYAAKGCADKMPCTVEEIRRKWTGDFPPFLAVVQKRFLPTRQKLEGAIEVPEELIFHESVSADGRSKAVYRLKAAVYHSGGVGGGHYTAYVKNSGRAYFCDDLKRRLPSETDKFLAGADHGYILKYELVEVLRG